MPDFFEQPILNSPYEYPDRHWELDAERQPDGRIRFWGEIVQPGERTLRFLRVVTLDDGEAIHNAFFDRRFRKDDG